MGDKNKKYIYTLEIHYVKNGVRSNHIFENEYTFLDYLGTLQKKYTDNEGLFKIGVLMNQRELYGITDFVLHL